MDVVIVHLVQHVLYMISYVLQACSEFFSLADLCVWTFPSTHLALDPLSGPGQPAYIITEFGWEVFVSRFRYFRLDFKAVLIY